MVIGDEIPISWIYALIAGLLVAGIYFVNPDTALAIALVFAGGYIAYRAIEFYRIEAKGTAIFLLIFGLLLANYGFAGIGLKQVLFQGLTVLSISKAEFTSKDPFFNGKAWVVTIIPGGMSQHLYGEFTPDEIYEKSGKKPLKKFTLDITYDKQVAEYPIKIDYTSRPIYSLEYKEWTCFWPPSEKDAFDHCGEDWQWNGKYGGSFTCFCIARHKESSYIGYLDNPDVHWKVKFKLCIDGGECDEKLFDSKNRISGKIGDIAYITWDFSGIKQALPSQEPYKAIYRNGEWQLISSSKYNEYLSSYSDFEDFVRTYVEAGKIDSSRRASLIEKINSVNYRARDVINNPPIFGDIINKGFISSAYVEYPLGYIAQVPVFTLYIRADKLGVYQPVPDIKIVDYSKSIQFKTGETGYVWVQLRNDGDERGSVDVWISNCYPITMKGATITRTINPNSETLVYIPVISGAETEITKTCTIYVKERVTEKLLTAQVNVKVSPQQICTPGVKRCSPVNPRLIEICNSQGTGWITYKTCQEGYICSYEAGQPVCKKEATETPSRPEEKECSSCFEWFRGIIAKMIGGEAVTMCKPKEFSITVFGFELFRISQNIYCTIFVMIVVAIILVVLRFILPLIKR